MFSKTGWRAAVALGFWALLGGCGVGLEGREDDLESVEQDVTFSGAGKFVVWQHNISWFTSASQAEAAVLHAMQKHQDAPDIFTFQECGATCICGEGGDYNASTGRCDSISGPSVARALKKISPATLNRYRFHRNGIRVIGFRADRFDQIGEDFHWGASESGKGETFAQCHGILVGDQLSVALLDTLPTPPKQILVSTGHWFVARDCACKQVNMLETHWKTAPELRKADGTDAKNYVDVHITTGDWNSQPSTELPTAYRKGSSCDGQALGDPHSDTGGPAFTFCQGAGGVMHPDTCTNKQKVDYVWARNYNGSGITTTGSPDTCANYSNDHRAVRTVFRY